MLILALSAHSIARLSLFSASLADSIGRMSWVGKIRAPPSVSFSLPVRSLRLGCRSVPLYGRL